MKMRRQPGPAQRCKAKGIAPEKGLIRLLFTRVRCVYNGIPHQASSAPVLPHVVLLLGAVHELVGALPARLVPGRAASSARKSWAPNLFSRAAPLPPLGRAERQRSLNHRGGS